MPRPRSPPYDNRHGRIGAIAARSINRTTRGRSEDSENAVMATDRWIVRGVAAAVVVILTSTAALSARQAPRTVTLTVTDPVGEKMTYSAKTITAKPGEKLKVRLVSLAKTPKVVMGHNFVLLKAGTNVKAFVDAAANARGTDYIPPSMRTAIIAETSMVGPSESMEVVFTAPTKPGTYTYLCSFAGHYAAGMTGSLIVK
jgi:azurin